MWRYSFFSFYLYIAFAGGLTCLYSPLSLAADLKGVVDKKNMPTKESIENHFKWTKIVISSNSGEETVNIDSISAKNIGQPDSVSITWVWQLPDGVSGDRVTHGLFPLAVTDISGTVKFTFYDLGTIHKKFVKEVEKQTKRKNYLIANKQIELANDFYDKVRELNGPKKNKANSWNHALYQAAYDAAYQVGFRRKETEQEEKEKVRTWLKEWIYLCIKQPSLRSKLGGALQSWSKFSKLAYSRVSDWPNKAPQDITGEIFLKEELRSRMIDDMAWLKDTIFDDPSVQSFLNGKSHLSPLTSIDSRLGTSLSLFAQAITDFAREWR